MMLLRHLIAGDLRRHRWLLLLWMITVIAATTVDGVLPVVAERPAAGNTAVLLDGLLGILSVLLRVVVIAQVIHTHALVGSDPFWLTRPIPRLLLLRAKAILLTVALVVVPVAAEVALMTVYDVPPGRMLGVAADTALFNVLYVALLATAAALTPTFTRFLLLCGGVLAAIALFLAVQATIESISRPDPFDFIVREAQPPGPPDPTSGIVVALLLLAAAGATLATQYGTRQIRRSVAVAAGSGIAALVAAGIWPWPVLRARGELPAWAPSSLTMEAQADSAWTRAYSTTAVGAQWRRVMAPVKVDGLRTGWSAGAGLLQASLQLDTETLSSAPAAYPVAVSTGSYRTWARGEAIRDVIGASTLVTDRQASSYDAPMLLLREADFRGHESAHGRYRGRFHVQLTQHRVEATVPLRVGATAAAANYRVTVSAIASAFGRAEVRLRDSFTTSSFDREPRVQRTYYLVNRRTGEAFEALATTDRRALLPRVFRGVSISTAESGFRTRNPILVFPPPSLADRELDEDWMKEADLVVVANTTEGAVERTLDIADFPLRAVVKK